MLACLLLSVKLELYILAADFVAFDKMPPKVCLPPRVKLVLSAPVPA